VTATGATWPRRRARWLLGLLVAGYLLLTAAYAAVTPVFEGFDGLAHYAAATFYRTERRLPELTPATVRDSYELITQPPLYHLVAGLAATGWPVEPARQLAQASVNPYFDQSLSYRQTVILPEMPATALAPAWIARFVSLLAGCWRCSAPGGWRASSSRSRCGWPRLRRRSRPSTRSFSTLPSV
jgi:ribosomal protein L40E